MGHITKKEELVETAKSILKETGAAEECRHGTLLDCDDDDAIEKARKKIGYMAKQSDSTFTNAEAQAAMSEAIRDLAIECSSCRREHENMHGDD